MDGDRAGPPRRDDEADDGVRRRLRQRLRQRRRRQGRRLRPARQRLARGERGGGRDRRRHGQGRRQPARRRRRRTARRPAARTSSSRRSSRSSARRSTTPGMLKREVDALRVQRASRRPASATTSRSAATATTRSTPGPGEDLANGNAGDDHIWLGDNARGQDHGRAARSRSRTTRSTPAGAAAATTTSGAATAPTTSTSGRARRRAGARPLPDERPGDVVPGRGRRGLAQRRRLRPGQLRGHRLHLRRLGSGHAAGERGRQRPGIGDRLLDWGGSYNGYYLCPSTYGDWVSTRAIAPGVIGSCRRCRRATARTDDRERPRRAPPAFRETAIVFTNEQKDNTKPIHADTPAHFTCGPGRHP